MNNNKINRIQNKANSINIMDNENFTRHSSPISLRSNLVTHNHHTNLDINKKNTPLSTENLIFINKNNSSHTELNEKLKKNEVNNNINDNSFIYHTNEKNNEYINRNDFEGSRDKMKRNTDRHKDIINYYDIYKSSKKNLKQNYSNDSLSKYLFK